MFIISQNLIRFPEDVSELDELILAVGALTTVFGGFDDVEDHMFATTTVVTMGMMLIIVMQRISLRPRWRFVC